MAVRDRAFLNEPLGSDSFGYLITALDQDHMAAPTKAEQRR